MLKPPDLDPKAVRLQFGRRAKRIGDADFLLREIEQRMFERLDVIKLAPAALIDIGCGLGRGLQALAQRYAGAQAIGIDAAPAMLAANLQARSGAGMAARLRNAVAAGLGRPGGPSLAAADSKALPFAASSFDLLWSNLAWHWFDDPLAVAAEWYRVIRPQGLVMFSSFGVDTLRELRALGAELPEFPDMHDVGDLLGQTGFAEPVLETERLTISYADPARLLHELGALGGNARRRRTRGLTGRGRRADWLRRLDRARNPDGRLTLTFEVIFAHAWCPPRKRLGEGLAAIHWQPKGPSKL